MFRPSLLIATVALVLATAPASAEPIRIAVGCAPADSCGDYRWAQAFGEALTAKGVENEIVSGGALGPDQAVADQMAQGLIEVGVTNFAVVRQIDPLILGLVVPYMFDDLAHVFRAVDQSDIDERIDASLAKANLKLADLLGVGGLGIFNGVRAVETVDDLAGLRLRAIDRAQLAVIEAWGAKGVVIDIGEVAGSLQNGVIDGYINPPIIALTYKHVAFFKHYTATDAGVGIRTALMSRDWYEGLDVETKSAVDNAVAAAKAVGRSTAIAAAEAGIDQIKDEGITVTYLTPEARRGFAERSRPVWDALMSAEDVATFVEISERTRQ